MPRVADAASSRRQTRMRRDYLYRKSINQSTGERTDYEKKRIIREALASGNRSLPTEVRASFDKLKKQIDYEDTQTSQKNPELAHIDDEYGDLGSSDPNVCVTTSRDPSSRLKQFVKEVRLLIPNSTRINRGNNRVDELVESCKESNFTDIVVVQETRGEPDGLVVCHLPLGPTAFFSLSQSVLRHDLEGGAAPMSEAYPHLILNNFSTPLGKRVGNILKALFPVPKPDSRRIITFSNDNDFISFRHHMYSKDTSRHSENPDAITLHEVGPRFEMRLYQIRLGTLDQKDADTEYVLRPFMNTASKRQML